MVPPLPPLSPARAAVQAQAQAVSAATRRSTRNINRPANTVLIPPGRSGSSVVSSIPSPPCPPPIPLAPDPIAKDNDECIEVDEGDEGDGGDSDVDGEEFEVHRNGVLDREETEEDVAVEVDELDMRGKFNNYVDLTGTGGMEVIGQISLSGDQLLNEEDKNEVKLPTPPVEWSAPDAQLERGEPVFENVDNPGDWDSYVFKPVFAGRSRNTKYKHHALPTGAIPVPKDTNGNRNVNGWEFFYKGWKNDNLPYRRGANTVNMFPKEMDGCLDGDLLKTLGLSKKRMIDNDYLFFFN